MVQNSFFSQLSFGSPYNAIYESLQHLREVFHRSGRFDDSNAKLDEIVKLLSTYLAYKRGLIEFFPNLDNTPRNQLIAKLEDAFESAINLPCYLNQDGRSIFGKTPSLLLREGDEDLAIDLLRLVENAVDSAFMSREIGQPFDVLNEAFGHFVRDNFRGNIEDAQYMTPPEVVDFVVDIALIDLQRHSGQVQDEPFIVADSSCGVGSFLTSFFHRSKQLEFADEHKLKLVGQDKVERMVRLSKVNLTLFESAQHIITLGNSLSRGSALDQWNGKVDLIITNPPFGAKFNYFDLRDAGKENLPFFSDISRSSSVIDSDLVFVDRNLSLLKPGGRLIIVLPDSAISANGMPSLLRQFLRQACIIRGVIELPSVTFAQAGTRTKTSVLYVQKKSELLPTPSSVFLAKADNIGFEVSSRKGVQIKTLTKANDLPLILRSYLEYDDNQRIDSERILCEEPSVVAVPYQEIMQNAWTPNHYSAARFNSIGQLAETEDVINLPLGDIAEFHSKKRQTEVWSNDTAFISVLHIVGEGMLDIAGIYRYTPKTPGYIVEPGDVILSKINPRIPRVIVVPDLAEKMLCSTEFEILTPKEGIDSYALAFLLLSDVVQKQIQSLTSGTSASHNRIKTKDLARVRLPIARDGSATHKRFDGLINEYRMKYQEMFASHLALYKLRSNENCWTGV